MTANQINLTLNGIQSLHENQEKQVILQIIDSGQFSFKSLCVTLSDGMHYIKKGIITAELSNRLFKSVEIQFSVIKVTQSKTIKSLFYPKYLITEAEIITDKIKQIIGKPTQFGKITKINEEQLEPENYNPLIKPIVKNKQNQSDCSLTKKLVINKIQDYEQSFTKKLIKQKMNQYNSIRELTSRDINFTILVRVIAVNRSSTTTRAGQVIQFFQVQLIDEFKELIIGKFFKQNIYYYKRIIQDQVYEIQGGKVTLEYKQGKERKKLIFGKQFRRLKQIQDVKQIPRLQDISLKLNELLKISDYTECPIICFVKDERQVTRFGKQNGKQTLKKIIIAYDPSQRIELPIILWNNLAKIQFSSNCYYFSSIIGKTYNGKKEYTTLFQTFIRELGMQIPSLHPIKRKHLVIKKQNQKQFKQIDMLQLHQKASRIKEGQTILSQVNCFISQVNAESSIIEQLCPKCLKIINQTFVKKCNFCYRQYNQAIYKYRLLAQFSDLYASIQAIIQDEQCQKLFKIKAKLVKNNSKIELNTMINQIKNLKVVVIFKTTVKFQGQIPKLTNIVWKIQKKETY